MKFESKYGLRQEVWRRTPLGVAVKEVVWAVQFTDKGVGYRFTGCTGIWLEIDVYPTEDIALKGENE